MSGPSRKKPRPTRRPYVPPKAFEGPWLPVYFDQLENDELPKLLVETCFNAGYPYTGVAFTLACVSKEFKSLVDTQADACLDKLRSLYDDWRQKRTLWVHAFRRADPDGLKHSPPKLVQPERGNVIAAWDAHVEQVNHLFGEEGANMVARQIGKTADNRMRLQAGGSSSSNSRSLEEQPPISFAWSTTLLCNLAKEQCMVCTGSGYRCVTVGLAKSKAALCVGRLSYSGATMTFRSCCLERRTIPVTLCTNSYRDLPPGGTVATASMDWVSKRASAAAKMNSTQMLPVTDNDPVANAVHLAMCMTKFSVGKSSLKHPDVLQRLSPCAGDPFWDGPEDKDPFRGRLFLYPNIYANRRDCFSARMGIRAGSGIEKAAERMYLARQEAAASLRKAQEEAVFQMAKQRVMPMALSHLADCEELVERMPLLAKAIRVLATKQLSGLNADGMPHMTGRVDETLTSMLEYDILDRVKSTIERASASARLDAKWVEAREMKEKASEDAMNWAMCLHSSYLDEYEFKAGAPQGFLGDLMNRYKPDIWPRTADRYELTAFHVFDAILAGSVKVSFSYNPLANNRLVAVADETGGRPTSGYKANTLICDRGLYGLCADDEERHLIANFSWTSGPGASRPFMWAKVRIASEYRDQVKRLAHLKNSERTAADQQALDTINKLLAMYRPCMHYCSPPPLNHTEKNAERMRKWHDDLFAEASKDGESLTVAMHATGMVWEHICCAIDTAWVEHVAWRRDNQDVKAWAPDFGTPERFCSYLLKRMAGEADFGAAMTMEGISNESRLATFQGHCARYLNDLYEHHYMPTSPSYSPTSPQYNPGHSAATGEESEEESDDEEGDEEEESGDESGEEPPHESDDESGDESDN